MYRNFYNLLESQYIFGHFLDKPYGMVEYWNVGYEKRKTGYPQEMLNLQYLMMPIRHPFSAFILKYSIKTI